MRRLLVIFALSLCAAAQTMVGLPEYGISLTGTASAPEVQNHSGKTVIAVTLWDKDNTGNGPVNPLLLFLEDPPNDGIPDGKSVIAVGAVPAGQPLPARLRGAPSPVIRPKNPTVRVELDSVIFADGSVVGPDNTGVTAKVDRIIAAMSKTANDFARNPDRAAAWQTIQTMASWKPTDGLPASVDREAHWAQWTVASGIVREKTLHGEDAAVKHAGRFAALPSLVKK